MTDDEWFPIADAPKDKEIEIRQTDMFPIRAYWGGGADKAWRDVNSHHQIKEAKEWRPLNL